MVEGTDIWAEEQANILIILQTGVKLGKARECGWNSNNVLHNLPQV